MAITGYIAAIIFILATIVSITGLLGMAVWELTRKSKKVRQVLLVSAVSFATGFTIVGIASVLVEVV